MTTSQRDDEDRLGVKEMTTSLSDVRADCIFRVEAYCISELSHLVCFELWVVSAPRSLPAKSMKLSLPIVYRNRRKERKE